MKEEAKNLLVKLAQAKEADKEKEVTDYNEPSDMELSHASMSTVNTMETKSEMKS